MTDPKLIIFDMDGTLVDSQHVIVEAMEGAFGRVGLEPPSRAETLSIVGLSLPQAMAALRPEAGAHIHADLVAAYKSGFLDQRARGEIVPLYDGAKPCLVDLSRHPRAVLGVATGKAHRGVDHTVESHDLHGMFTNIQTADTNPSKPDPSMVLSACAQTGIAAEHAVMIGDTSFDMEMGRAAGVATIAVTWGYHSAERLADCAPDRMVADFAGLRGALAELIGIET